MAQEKPQHKQSQGMEQPHQLSENSQRAIANLHALNVARMKYAKAGADVAADPDVKQFMLQQASEYERSDARLSAFADLYGVDLESDKMQEMAHKTEKTWAKENKKLKKEHGSKAAKAVLDTFIDRNEDAISDLRTLRGEVQEDKLKEIINDRIGALEEESTRAQQLRQKVQRHEQMQKESK